MFVLLADGDIRAPVFRVGYFLWFVGERDIGQGERDGTALRFSAFPASVAVGGLGPCRCTPWRARPSSLWVWRWALSVWALTVTQRHTLSRAE